MWVLEKKKKEIFSNQIVASVEESSPYSFAFITDSNVVG